MIAVKTRTKTYYTDKTVNEVDRIINDKSSEYLKIQGDLIKKREVVSVNAVKSEEPKDTYTNTLPPQKRQENLYVLTYMKAHIPRHMKKLGRRLKKDEIRAIIAEARVSYADERV